MEGYQSKGLVGKLKTLVVDAFPRRGSSWIRSGVLEHFPKDAPLGCITARKIVSVSTKLRFGYVFRERK